MAYVRIQVADQKFHVKTIVGEDDLLPVTDDPLFLTRGRSPEYERLNDAWRRVINATALIVDRETLKAIEDRNVYTLERLAIAKTKRYPPPVRLNHRLAQARIAIPIGRDIDKLHEHIVPHTGFMLEKDVVVSAKHARHEKTEGMRFVFGAKWDRETNYFDMGNAAVYTLDTENPQVDPHIRICKYAGCVAYRVKREVGSRTVFPVEIERFVDEYTPVTALTHAFGLPLTTIGKEPIEFCVDEDDCEVALQQAALDVFTMSSGSPVTTVDEDPKVVGMILGQKEIRQFTTDASHPGEAILEQRTGNADRPMAEILKIGRILDELNGKQA